MQYIITAYDGEGMLEKRMEVRPRHIENMGKVNVEPMNVVIMNNEKVGK